MRSILLLSILCTVILFSSCRKNELNRPSSISAPGIACNYAMIDTSTLKYLETDYVPVYSEIYHMDGSRSMLLTVTLSIRNTSLADSAYILKAEYYDSHGIKLRDYLDSSLLLKPLESHEFVVEYKENKGGAGANFIVDWGAKSYSDQVLIQSVMIGTSGQQGISFISNSKTIKQVQKKN